MAEELEGYITVNEAAHKMGRSGEQVRRYLREGKLEGRRVGGQWFIRETAVLYATREQEAQVQEEGAVEMSDVEVFNSIEFTGRAAMDKGALFERIKARRENLRRRWENSGVSVDAVDLVNELREEEQ